MFLELVALYRVLNHATKELQQETTEAFPATVADVLLGKRCNETCVLCNGVCNEEFRSCNDPWEEIPGKKGVWLHVLAFSLHGSFHKTAGSIGLAVELD